MNLESGPGFQRKSFVNPALVSGGVIPGVAGLAGQVIPIRQDIGFDVNGAAISASPAGGEVVSLRPIHQAGRDLGVGICKGDDVRIEIAVQKLPGIFDLQFFSGLAQVRRMFMGHRVITDLVALQLDSPPIVDPGGLGYDKEKCGSQMTLIEFRNGYVQMHVAGIVKS